jgi:carboxymethylenebutenolidase
MPRLDVQIPAPAGPARHGFAVPDNPTYDADANSRHWAALRQLYQTHLGEKGA